MLDLKIVAGFLSLIETPLGTLYTSKFIESELDDRLRVAVCVGSVIFLLHLAGVSLNGS